MLSKISALFPLVLSLVACILSYLVLFSGHQKGFMEDYAIARVNTSMLGQNLLNTSSGDGSKSSGLLGSLENGLDDIKSSVEKELNDITGDIADKLADKLGIHEWYSIHVMSFCEGQYKPNATAPGAGFNVTNCTHSSPDDRFNLSKILNHELNIGPVDLNLANIKWPSEVQDGIDLLNKALLALFIFYVLGVAFSSLAMLACAAALLLGVDRRGVPSVNLGLAGLAALCMVIGSIITTVAASEGVQKVNKYGHDIGLSAKKGTKFVTLTWIAAAFMLASSVYWMATLCLAHRERHRSRRSSGSYVKSTV